MSSRGLTNDEYEFVDLVYDDIKQFLADRRGQRALLFPAVNPRRRYLIHNTVQENFPQLTTISVGQGDQRRTAVTFKKNCNKQGGRNEDDKKDSCPNDRVSEESSAVSKQQVQHKSTRQQQQQHSRSQGQSQPKQQSQQSQQQSQSPPQTEKATNSSGKIAKESRRPEQLLYSPQKQGSLQRIDLKKEAVQQSGKQQQQQSHSNQGTHQQQQQQPQHQPHLNQGAPQQQQQQKELVVAQSQQNRTQQQQQQNSAQQQKQQKSPEGQEISPKSHPAEEIPRSQRDNRTAKRDSELAGKAEQKAEQEAEQDPRCIRERSSSSCNSETGSSSVQSTLETPNDRLKNDDPMRDSGAEENQNSSCNNSRRRRNRRNRKQRDCKTGEGGTGEYHYQQQHHNDHGHVNGKPEDFNKGKKTRQSESLHNLSGGLGVGGSGVVKSASGGEICDDRITPNISNKNNPEFNDNSNRVFVQRVCENSPRKFHSQTTSGESVNWKSNSGTNRQQNNIRYPGSSWKEEFRESESPSPSDYIAKESPERMPVTVPSEQGNNRRRGKAPAQIYRPPPARSTRDTNLPPQPYQQQTYYNQQQQQIHLHQPAYSQQFQPKQLFSPSHNYTPQHHHPSHPPNNYQQQHNYYPQQQDMHHYHSLPRRQRNDSESSTATLSGENQNNRGKGRRPDQVLYVPRGRRSVANDPGSARGTPTPLIDYESHPRPPSPAYSICSTASEFSGRNRYNKQGSRQGSQVSIYDGENDRVHGKPPLSRDFSRESTPGYGRQKGNAGGRFSSQTLQLIERCLNHETDHKYNEYSNNETDFNSSSPKNNKGGGGGGGRVQKSPTPTRDIHSIHSKENVIHPIESNSRSRRSRKNRRRQSRSRDGSADQYQNVAKDGKGNESHNEDWQSSPGERGLGSCERIFYNSNFNSSQDRYDRGYDNYDRYSSINSSRASSRNSSRERTPQRNINHNWRGGSNPPSPSKGPIMFYQTRHSPGKPPSGRLGSLPNVALDCGESPKRLSNHKEENQRFYTLPGKNKSPIINDLHTQTAEKNNIEYGSGCIVSDRIDTNPCMDTSQNTSLTSDLMHQNQSSETHDNHNEKLIKSNINSSNSSMHTEPVSEVINELQECNLNRENKIYSHDSSLKEVKNIKNNSVNSTANIEEDSSVLLDENLRNESTSEENDISSEETLNKPTDFISETPLEEVYCNTEAEPSMTESTKDSTEEVTSSDNDTKDNLSETKEGNIDEDDKKKNPKKFQFNWADEVEDSWDNLYDDDGECLDPEIKRQLSDSLGKIKLEKPANDYYSFQPREPEINEEEYGHVIEIYDFPVSFKTQDLMMVFSSFQNTGFDIKWVDDTHALGIFATALIAAEALSVDHPFLKTRSLSLATKSSKAKAMRIAEALLPYKPRPATSASLARRLVSGALGLKVNISREVREAERQKLKDAKAQKRLAAKQRVDAWEGTLT